MRVINHTYKYTEYIKPFTTLFDGIIGDRNGAMDKDFHGSIIWFEISATCMNCPPKLKLPKLEFEKVIIYSYLYKTESGSIL